MAKKKSETRYAVPKKPQKKIEILYHKPTDTIWTNDPNWENKYQDIGYDYGVIEASDTDVIGFSLKMKDMNYINIPKSHAPFEFLTKVKKD